MPDTQVNFAAFAAAFVCPPPAVNDAAPAVTAPAVSGQGVGTITVFEPSRALSYAVVEGGWQGDYYIDWQSLGGCLDAPDYLPSGGSCAHRFSDGGVTVDGFSSRPGC